MVVCSSPGPKAPSPTTAGKSCKIEIASWRPSKLTKIVKTSCLAQSWWKVENYLKIKKIGAPLEPNHHQISKPQLKRSEVSSSGTSRMNKRANRLAKNNHRQHSKCISVIRRIFSWTHSTTINKYWIKLWTIMTGKMTSRILIMSRWFIRRDRWAPSIVSQRISQGSRGTS
jgi:hypothetical protein